MHKLPYLLLWTLTGCTSAPTGLVDGHIQTISRAPYEVVAEPKAFETSFFPGTRSQIDTVGFRMQPQFLGNLAVPSGQFVAVDPFTSNEQALPFAAQFPKGRFPVELAMAVFRNDQRVAFARVLFSSKPVKSWQLALLPGQKPLPVYSEDYYGFSVDGGVAMLVDAASKNRLYAHLAQDQTANQKIFIDSFKLDTKHPREGFLYAVGQDTLATFSTGFGDGSYAAYIGFDDDHRPCRLLIDFQVIEWQ